jgi:Haem-NO-binding
MAQMAQGWGIAVKGIIFNLLEEAVSAEHGEQAWDELLNAAGVDGAYTSLGNYPDADLMKLVEAAAERFSLPQQDVIRWLGRSSLPALAEKYPDFFKPHSSTRPFLLTLNEIIHPEVRKLYPGADVPAFDYDASSPDVLVMGYESPRKLCALGEGLIQGAAAHYGEQVTIEQPQCMNRGDEKCLLRISLAQ